MPEGQGSKNNMGSCINKLSPEGYEKRRTKSREQRESYFSWNSLLVLFDCLFLCDALPVLNNFLKIFLSCNGHSTFMFM